jgi:hypothetical protein
MVIPPATFVLLTILLAIFVKPQNQFNNLILLALVIEVFLRMGRLIIFDVYNSISFELFIQYLLIFYCLFRLKRIPQKIRLCYSLLVFSYFIPILLLYLFPSSALVATPDVSWDDIIAGASMQHPVVTLRVLKVTLKMSLFAIVFIVIYKEWKKVDYCNLLNSLSKISNIFIIIGVIEFVVKNILNLNELWGECLISFWGEVDSTSYQGRLRGNSYELTNFTQEASHYAYVLMFVCIVKLANNIIQSKKRKLSIGIWTSLFLMAFSTSFSVVYLSISFFVIYIMYRWSIQRPKHMKYEKTALLISFVVLISSLSVFISMNIDNYVFNRIVIMLENYEDIFQIDWTYGDSSGDGSAKIRMVSMIQTLVTFFNRPFFGYSLSSIEAHSSTAYFLASVGLFGLYCWVKFYFKILPFRKMMFPKEKLYNICIFLLLAVNLFGGDKRTIFGLMLFVYSVSACAIFSINETGIYRKN